ncbi:MAG: class I tRNA ligase family protein, partial [Spirochaetia bacterium]|nr:class I tRNA ligase family protein [Spirochaetia bacterium]
KMSKSLCNVINPDEVVRELGADSIRLYEMFMGPLSVSKAWSTTGISGVYRFLDRIWRIADEKKFTDAAPSSDLNKLLHKTIKKVSLDTKNLEFNTAISQMMVFINEVNRLDEVPVAVWKHFVLLLSPYAPHLAEELWEKLGHNESVSLQKWPEWDEALTHDDEVTIVVQINSKNRSQMTMPKGASKEELEKEALSNDRIKELLAGKTVIKTIVVPGKLVNFVVR